MSETPETDANQIFLGINPDEGDYYVPAEFSRKLEQQRNETIHNLASIVAAILKRDGRDVFDMSAIDRLAELHTAERQRDEAVYELRDKAERYRLDANAMMMQRDRLVEELNELKEECGLRWAQKRIAIDELKDVTEQRDRLAEALKDVMKYRKGEEPHDYWRLPESHRRNVQFDGWNEIENRINAALAAVKGGSDE